MESGRCIEGQAAARLGSGAGATAFGQGSSATDGRFLGASRFTRLLSRASRKSPIPNSNGGDNMDAVIARLSFAHPP